MGVLGDIQYRAALVWKVLNGNTTTTRKFLRQVGTGAASAAPAWDTLQAADLPSTAVTPGSYTATNLTVDQQGRITAAASGSSGSGTVTNTGTLTNHALIKGNGGVDVSALGSLGTTTTVLHGNAAGDPSYGAVVEADITLANNTTNNVSTSAHGFAPILPNDATKFLNGVGAYAVPSGGSGTVTTTGSPASGNLAKFSGATSIVNGDLSGDVTTSGTLATTIANDAVTTAKILNANVTLAKIASAAASSKLVGSGASGSGAAYSEITLGTNLSMTSTTLNAATSSVVVQVVSTETGSVSTGNTPLPFDDTIPQSSEGTQFMSLAITPTSASNRLRIDIVAMLSPSAAPDNVTAALFQDSTAGALAAVGCFVNVSTAVTFITYTHLMTAGTTSATTFKVRAGQNGAGTVTFNGQSAGRKFGGVAASSMVITELTP